MSLLQPVPANWNLTEDQIKQIFDIEKKLADKLRNYPQQERLKMYSPIYDEYFASLPFHPQFTVKKNTAATSDKIEYLYNVVKSFIKKDETFVEIGAGDCALSILLANKGYRSVALDVTDSVAKLNNETPLNFTFMTFDGFVFPFKNKSSFCAFSNQLLEHLHPDDADLQTKGICDFLKEGGRYICITPNKLTGPHDVSRFYTNNNVGFHLKEYSANDLKKHFLKAGFTRVKFYTMIKGKSIAIPYCIVFPFEKIMSLLPNNMRRTLARMRVFSLLINYSTVSFK